jgi:hypothetical protein
VEVASALYPNMDLWNVLWGGVRQHLEPRELLAWADRSEFKRSAKVALPYVEAVNEAFLKNRTEPAGLEELLKDAASPEEIPARLWILAAAGILDVLDDNSPTDTITEPIVYPSSPLPRMSRTPLPPAPRATGSQAEDLRTEHAQRMEKDYYAFLGLPPSASSDEVRGVARKLAQRMNALSHISTLPEDTMAQVRDMLVGVQRVYGTFTDRNRKEEYDRKMASGQAPLIKANPKFTTSLPPERGAQNRDFDLPDLDSNESKRGFFKKGKKP